MNNILDKSVVDSIQSVIMIKGQLKEALEDRIHYIIQKICELKNSTLNYWYVDGAEEGEIGDTVSIIYDNQIHLNELIIANKPITASKYAHRKDLKIIGTDNIEYNLSSSCPTRWLYEDFELEIKDGIKLYEDHTEKVAANHKLKNQIKEDLIQSAKSKLSIEEQKAVGIYRK